MLSTAHVTCILSSMAPLTLPRVSVTRGAARGSVAFHGSSTGTAARTASADVEVILDNDMKVEDEVGAVRAAQERGADVVVNAIEAMQAQLERMKQAALNAQSATSQVTGPGVLQVV